MKLKLNAIEVNCIIGERPDERVRLQRLLVDVVLEESDAACATDALADAVDYAALAERIRATLVEAKCQLIERAAKLVHDVCVRTPGVRRATVTVKKSGAVPGLGSAEAMYGDC